MDKSFDLAVNVNYQEQGLHKLGGRSALHYAVITNNRQLVNLLIKNYADVLIKDLHDQTPMHLLCMKSQGSIGNLEIFKRYILLSQHDSFLPFMGHVLEGNIGNIAPCLQSPPGNAGSQFPIQPQSGQTWTLAHDPW